MYEEILYRLSKSKFRNSFKLNEKDKKYAEEKGIEVLKQHAYEFIKKRISPAYIPNDGKQTPMKGHPVFTAQHATAACCRSCINKWHGFPVNTELSQTQQDYLVDLIMAWIDNQLKT